MHDIGKPVLRAGGQSGDHSSLGYAYLKKLWPQDQDILDCVRLHHAAALRAAPPADRQPRMDRLHRRQHFCRGRPAEHGHGGIRVPAPSAACARVFAYERRASRKGGLTCSADRRSCTCRWKIMDALTAAQYQAAVDALAPRLAELSRTEQWLNSLLCLLESYLSAFPSSTNTAESPDISLFDHLKTTAAIGVCISEYLAAEQETQFKKRLFDKEKQFMDEQAFLLYSADFSGIQKFIYTVASEKALRSLRSRSFFLELAMEHYADELLSLCGVGRTNLLYTGGGHCYMLLPNTAEVRTAIERWNRRFNDWLSEQFGISLFLAHGYTAVQRQRTDRCSC